ncbi:MAG: hypothetical protein L6Q47_08325 [Ignavibacteriaceae bacterium]|nr:hypothetical protein [Ignavibacteriaceae bacterium]
MRPALSEQVNNELEAVYFIDKVYRLDPLLYEKSISGLKEYKEYFALPADIASGNITSPGEFTRSQILKKFSGHDVPARRNVFKRIKEMFKRCWFQHAGFPPLPHNAGGVTEFRKSHLDEFSLNTIFLPFNEREVAVSYAYFTASSATDVFWINAKGAADEEGLTSAIMIDTAKSVLPAGSKEPVDLRDALKILFEHCRGVVIIENAPFLDQEKNRERIFQVFNSSASSPSAQLILIAASAPEETQATISGKLNKQSGEGSLIYVILILAIAAVLLYTSFSSEQDLPKGALFFRYFADEVEQDPFPEGVLLTWTDAKGTALETELIHYADWHLITQIPEGAEKLLLSKGSFEFYPDILPAEKLIADSVVIVLYKTIMVPDVASDSLIRNNAQRWYTFTLTDSTRILITCESVSGDLSPQAAIFTDRLGKNRLLPNDNILGDKKSVEITGTLPPGKYYLKVRGYDRTTGKYRLQIKKH